MKTVQVTAQDIIDLAMQCNPVFESAIDFAKSVRLKSSAAAINDEMVLNLIRCSTALTDLAAVLMHDRKIHAQRAELAALKAKRAE